MEDPLPSSSPAASSSSRLEGLVYWPDDYLNPLNLHDVFPNQRPLEVELGSGDGGFLLRWAERNPDHNFLGIERLLGRLKKIDKRGRRMGLQNLRVMRIEAAYFTEYLLPPVSADAIHIYFPDPWPKRKHVKYRLITPAFSSVISRALKPSGCVHVRTDHSLYFAQMQEVFSANPQFIPVRTDPNLLAIKTDFEEEFAARGVPSQHASYKRA